MLLIHHKEIVEIAAYLLRRIHGCIDIELCAVRERREDAGQHGALNVSGNIQLRPDSLLLCRNTGQILNIVFQTVGHVIKCLTKQRRFIIRIYFNPVIQIPAADLPCPFGQRINRLRQTSGKFIRQEDNDNGNQQCNHKE